MSCGGGIRAVSDKNKRKLSALEIFWAIGRTDDELLLECESYKAVPLYKRKSFIASVSAAACFGLIITGAALIGSFNDNAFDSAISQDSPEEKSEAIVRDDNENTGAASETVHETASETAAEIVTETFTETAAEQDDIGDLLECEISETEEEEVVEEAVVESAAPDQKTELEKITLSGITADGMGFEELMFFGDEDFLAHISQMKINAETMPVYKNLSYDKYGLPLGMTYDELKEKFDTLARYFGISGCETTEDTYPENENGIPSDTVTSILCSTDEVNLYVYADGSWSVIFGESEVLPYSDAEENALYSVEKYFDLFGFENPAVFAVYDRDTCGELGGTYYVYDKTGDEIQNLINMTYSYAQPILYDDGTFGGFHVSSGMAYREKLGDYPIISEDEANAALREGRYITTVPSDLYSAITEENIVSCGITYRNSAAEEMLIPYYKFYVRLDKTPGGLQNYGAFYVPAIEMSYIANAGIFDGRFN